MDIKIDKDVPFQEVQSEAYPLNKLNPGESFAMDYSDAYKIRYAIQSYIRINVGKKFATRKMKEDGKDVVRVWRLE